MALLGKRLRDLRQRQGLSQRRLAIMVQVDMTYISKVESGDLLPGSETLARLAKALEADERELFTLTGQIPHGLKDMLKGNPLLTELVYALSERVLPDEVYRKLLLLAENHQEKGEE